MNPPPPHVSTVDSQTTSSVAPRSSVGSLPSSAPAVTPPTAQVSMDDNDPNNANNAAGSGGRGGGMKFMRNFFGRRNRQQPQQPQQDPVLGTMDSQLETSTVRSIRPGVAESRTTGSPTNANNGGRQFGWFSAQRRAKYFRYLLRHRLWKYLMIVCSFILLFGAQIRTLATDVRADTAFDAIFMTVFCLFLFELIMRCDVEANYFSMDCVVCIPSSAHRHGTTAAAREANERSIIFGPCKIGSFLFWCELASTLALLLEISFVRQKHFSEREINIGLDAAGIPISGMEGVNIAAPVEYEEFGLLIIIAKTARVARFIRSTTAMKLSSNVNWYWFWNLLNPFWYWSALHGAVMGVSSDNHHHRSSGSVAGGPENSSEREGSQSDITGGRRNLVRQASWGGLALGTVALVHVKHLREQEEERRRGETGIAGYCRKILRTIGLMRQNDESLRRQLAAIKIQRAWRAAKYHNDEIHEVDHSDRDFAWRARSSNISHHRLPTRSLNQGENASPHSRGSRMGNLHASRNHSRATYLRSNPNAGHTANNESQVGSAMRELTGQRVAIGIILALVLTVLFTYTENDATRPTTMVVLHAQTANEMYADQAIQASRSTSAKDLFQYTFANGTVENYQLTDGEPTDNLRDSEKLRIQISDTYANVTIGMFSSRDEAKQAAIVSLLSTIFIILIWFFGVTAFVGPVMVLVVIPIERMVQLLGMLTMDPLGYQATSRYRRFVAEEDEITKNTRWTKEILRGMETSFLMLTILRIGSLMKVGFGSAGVEIIRNNLERNTLLLSERGLTVSCIFLFCDIRQFTDATECLQEEVFVFTNRIAAVVHSICHSFGGSANKNIGDAFLLSWRLQEDERGQHGHSSRFGGRNENFVAKHNQADKALLSVVKICIALHHDDYFIDTLSEVAREALLAKLAKRKGPTVQLGFGLHAGKAVQGAIGSQRKIDATYVSEAVERAEFLESSTKKYGVKMLMSDSFHRLLHPNNRRRCRKVDQIMIKNEDDDEDDESGEIMELLTFDMDIDALWKNVKAAATGSVMGKSDSGGHESDDSERKPSHKKGNNSNRQLSSGKLKARRLSVRVMGGMKQEPSDGEMSDGGFLPGPAPPAANVSSNSNADLTGDEHNQHNGPPELVLPTGPALYNASVWVSEDMRRIRQLYSDGIFFQKFNSGLNSFYSRDWEHARQCFVTILERFEDGPSRYFLTQIEKNGGKPPRNFQPFGSA